MNAGPPSFAGSPGRSELARGIRFSSRSGSVEDIKVSSPQHQPQVRLPRQNRRPDFCDCTLRSSVYVFFFLHDFSVSNLAVCLLTQQASELEDVAEFPLDGSGVNVTPPRSIGGLGGDSGSPGSTPAMKSSAHNYFRARQRHGKRRYLSLESWR